jgi:hypothetical protein
LTEPFRPHRPLPANPAELIGNGFVDEGLKLIANPVAIDIIQAFPVAIEPTLGVIAKPRLRRICIEIAGLWVLAPCDFCLVANTVLIIVEEAVTSAVKARLGVSATVIFVGGGWSEIAGLRICATSNFKFIADSIIV